MKDLTKRMSPSKIGLVAIVLTAAVFAASAYLTYAYGQDVSDSVGMIISIAVMILTATLILILAWTLGRHEKIEKRSNDVVFLRMVRGPRCTPKEEPSEADLYISNKNLKDWSNQ